MRSSVLSGQTMATAGLLVLIAFSACLFPQQTCAVDLWGDELTITLDYTYATKYIWYGYDLLWNNDGAHQPSIEFAYRGFFAGVWGSWADQSGHVGSTELDYYLGYGSTLFEECPLALDFALTYTYFDYPKVNSDLDGQEIKLQLSLPNLIPVGPANVIPRYEVAYEFDGIQSSKGFDDGWIQLLGLSYGIPIPDFIPTQEGMTLDLDWSIVYNDGTFGSDSGWSHTTLGVSTTATWGAFYFTPALYRQWSFEDTVNDENEWYATFSVGCAF